MGGEEQDKEKGGPPETKHDERELRDESDTPHYSDKGGHRARSRYWRWWRGAKEKKDGGEHSRG